MKCPRCGSEHYLYIEADWQLGCLDCGYRPDYYGVPIYVSLEEAAQIARAMKLLENEPNKKHKTTDGEE